MLRQPGAGNRAENERSWRVSAEDIIADNYNLDLRNPHADTDLEHRPPAELLTELIDVEKQILDSLESLHNALVEGR